MAAVPYWEIRKGIRAALLARPELATAAIRLVPSVDPAAEMSTPGIEIHLADRTTPEDEQVLANGRITVYHLTAILAVIYFSMSSREEAVRLCHEAVGAAELALMADRTLGGRVETLWLLGGPMVDEKPPTGPSYAVAAIELRMRVRATL